MTDSYDVALVTPPLSVNALLIVGIPLVEWVIILNFAYIAVTLAYKLWTIWKEHRNGGKQ